MIEMRGKSIFKEEPLDTNFFRNLLKQRQLFRIVATYFSISFIQLVETDFVPSRNNIFLVRAILLLVETIIGIRRKQFSKKVYSCQWATYFLVCEKQCFCIFHKLLLVIVFYCLVETSFSTKSLVPASANGFSGQQKPLSFVQRFSIQ